MRGLGLFILLCAMMIGAYYYGELTEVRETVALGDKQLTVADGDSFSIGTRKLRLRGLDAPEYAQTCKHANGAGWACGKAARASLEQLLRTPGLSCVAEAQDKYARALATCSNNSIPDIGAAQVKAGMAVSDEFQGMQSYGAEERYAKLTKKGLWGGQFAHPSDWRRSNPAP